MLVRGLDLKGLTAIDTFFNGAEKPDPFRFERDFPHFVNNNRNNSFLHKRLNSVTAQHIVNLSFAVQIQRFRLTGYFENSRNKFH